MNTLRRVLAVAATAATIIAPMAALAAEKPLIKVLVGFPPGGGTDAIARLIVERLPEHLDGQKVIIENKPGIGGMMAADAVSKAEPDGTTYMIAPNATPTFLTLNFAERIKWDIFKDFAPVAQLVSYPLGMAVSNETGAASAPEFVAWAKAHPDKANVGTPGAGGQNHFLSVEFAKAAGIELPLVPYKGSGPLVTDLIGGHVPAGVTLMGGMMNNHKAGKLKVIGIFTSERSPLMPDIPTMKEQGIDVTSGEGWTAMWAPAGTPKAELERMQSALEAVLGTPEMREALMSKLFVVPDFRPAAQAGARERAEIDHWRPIIQASGFKPSK
ncbi:MAG: tripartite tricarboxylate transporter substrate-binding protein [Burkholderiaceae bacterium]